MHVDRNGLEILARDECLRLLASATLGRIGFTSGALPSILPVTFCLVGEHIVVRATRGSTLAGALQGGVVAFEADDFDPVDLSGWSVAVTGIVTQSNNPSGLDGTHLNAFARWAPEADEAIIAISTEFVSGRRVVNDDEAPAIAVPCRP